MYFRVKFWISVVAFLGLLSACGYEEANQPHWGYEWESEETEDELNGTTPGTDNANPQNPGATEDEKKAAQESGIFSLFCSEALSVPVTGAQAKEQYTSLCTEDGRPKKLFGQILFERAYRGSGDPEVILLREPEHDNDANTTSMLLAGAVAVTGDIKPYFERFTELVSNPDEAKA